MTARATVPAPSAAAGTDGNKDHVEVGSGLKQFERDGADSRDQERLVGRMDVVLVMSCGMVLGREPRHVKITAGLDDISP